MIVARERLFPGESFPNGPDITTYSLWGKTVLEATIGSRCPLTKASLVSLSSVLRNLQILVLEA